MHLKSLTVKGFKSFASATTLRLEPGITCVVGPNGSGKSNVVDAIAWVLGEQGAKALRGGKMEDVIFAGTSGRPPLGRAEVTLTIDNSDGELPIEYTEVSITRRMFRSGESEYEINGASCRLLDIQELLSDSGIGREMHVIVGQGQLDAVLHAKPEDRRAFVEEAAGVLKHRKRKEKALRKLDAMQANLNRVTDLAAELRRQLRPLGRQAEVARRAAGIQADLRDARLRLLADDLTRLRDTLDKDIADETALRERRQAVEEQNATLVARLATLEAGHAADAPALATAQETWYTLSSLQERFRSVEQLAAERLRHLAAEPDEQRPGREPEELTAEAERVREQEAALRAELEAAQERLTEAEDRRRVLENQLAEADRALVTAARAIADRREGLARLVGQVNAARSRATAAAEEIARHGDAVGEAQERAQEAAAALELAREESDGLDDGDVALAEQVEEATEALRQAEAYARDLAEAERATEREASEWKAREEALSLGLRRKDGAGALLAAAEDVPGLLGSVAALLAVEPGHEAALAAALGTLADAVAVSDPDGVPAAVNLLKKHDAGRASLLVARPGEPTGAGGGTVPGGADGGGTVPGGADGGGTVPGGADGGGTVPGGAAGAPGARPAAGLPEGVRPVLDLVRCPHDLRPALERVLHDVVLTGDLDAACALVQHRPELRAVTPDGDLVGAWSASGGSATAPSFIEVQAAVDEARQNRIRAQQRLTELGRELDAAQERVRERTTGLDAVGVLRKEADGRRHAAARRLAELGAAARSARAEAERLAAARAKADGARQQAVDALVGLEQRLAAAGSEPVDEEPSTAERDQLAALLPRARQNEMEVRLAVRTAEERAGALAGRADALLRQAEGERAARERAAERRAARQRGAAIARAVGIGARSALERMAVTIATATTERDALAAARSAREAELSEVRTALRRVTSDLERLTGQVHRDEVARAEQRLRIEQLEVKAAEDFGIDLTTLLAEYGPGVEVPPSSADVAAAEAAGRPVPQPRGFERSVQEKRAARADRELAMLGKVNPLALEEFAALEERYKYLSDQLEDLKATRRDLLTVVKDVDERILSVFTSAYRDTAREFEEVFKVLFPGGEGRLVLTEPDDMLTTGIDVEARPPGKKIKRLSLLSGGERSLTSIALLVAIFRARPSPFYIMDEVEAALDDVNLGRLLTLMTQLRERSQLIIITHQKRTMEIADALYGVTMRGGVTQVISQRIKDGEAA